jgi:acyl-CoA thioester hydrolase
MALSDFKCITRFRVPFCDVDMMQHANHASYIVWAETARSVYFADVLKEVVNGTNGMILARLGFEYERPLDYLEAAAVACRISRIGSKSFDFAYEIWSESHSERAAHGFTTMVAYNYDAKTTVTVPERWRDIASGYEVIAPILR